MQCPVDNTRLEISERQGIEIDYCPTCRGVWLDRGELDKLIERQASFNQPRREEPRDTYRQDEYRESRERRDHDDDDDDDYRHNNGHRGDKRHHKKEGFLGDLFDF
jgi:Zn-finger nucleic acid-binding protein